MEHLSSKSVPVNPYIIAAISRFLTGLFFFSVLKVTRQKIFKLTLRLNILAVNNTNNTQNSLYKYSTVQMPVHVVTIKTTSIITIILL